MMLKCQYASMFHLGIFNDTTGALGLDHEIEVLGFGQLSSRCQLPFAHDGLRAGVGTDGAEQNVPYWVRPCAIPVVASISRPTS